jgi:hypothetical protein
MWSLWLAWRIAARYSINGFAATSAAICIAAAVGIGDLSWALLFFVW